MDDTIGTARKWALLDSNIAFDFDTINNYYTHIMRYLFLTLALLTFNIYAQGPDLSAITDLELRNIDKDFLEKFPLLAQQLPVRIRVSLNNIDENYAYLKYHGSDPNTSFRNWTRAQDGRVISALYISSTPTTVKLQASTGETSQIERSILSSLDNIFIYTAEKYTWENGILKVPHKDLNGDVEEYAMRMSINIGFNHVSKDNDGNLIYSSRIATESTDRFSQVTSYKVAENIKEQLSLKDDHKIDISANRHGNKNVTFFLYVSSTSREWRYLRFRDTYFLLGDSRFTYDQRNIKHIPHVISEGVFEFMGYELDEDFITAVLENNSFEFKIGTSELTLSENQITILKQFIEEVKDIEQTP